MSDLIFWYVIITVGGFLIGAFFTWLYYVLTDSRYAGFVMGFLIGFWFSRD